MPDLSNVTTTAMVLDLADSVYDVFLCTEAMRTGGADSILKDGTPVAQRAGHNLHFIGVICRELLAREYKPVPHG